MKVVFRTSVFGIRIGIRRDFPARPRLPLSSRLGWSADRPPTRSTRHHFHWPASTSPSLSADPMHPCPTHGEILRSPHASGSDERRLCSLLRRWRSGRMIPGRKSSRRPLQFFQRSVRVSISRKLCYGNDEKITERHRKISGVDGRHAGICWLASRMFGRCGGVRGRGCGRQRGRGESTLRMSACQKLSYIYYIS